MKPYKPMEDWEKPFFSSMHALRRFALAGLIGGLLAAMGCSALPGESFTLQAELPANFKFSGDAYYAPATGETCTVPQRSSGREPDRKYFESDYQNTTHRVEFKVPLTERVGGCPLVLSSIKIDLTGKWGERKWGNDWGQIHSDFASLSFRDELPMGYPGMPASGVREFQGQCMWLFRTMGPERAIRKILKCQDFDGQGQLQKWRPGGALQRDQLAGKTVRLEIGLTEEEEPYYGRSWQKTPSGWKPCLETKEAFRCQTPPTFTDFKMPDGRTCTVYPNCNE